MPNPEPPFSFRAVQVFIAIVEAGSVTGAARRLGLSPSSVSQQLANLEAALGTRLIERSARTFHLTAPGHLFRARALRLLDEVGAARAELALADEAPRMTLDIASVEDFDAYVAPVWLSRLSSDFPRIAFRMRSGASHENHSALESRAADMIIAVDAAGPAEWVEHHPILRDTFLLVTAAGAGPVRTLDALTARPFVRYVPELYIGRQIEAQLRRTGLRPERRYEMTTNAALMATVAETGGWAISTVLAVLGTPAVAGVTVHPLPLPRFSRQLALQARRGALGALPALFAARLRESLSARIAPRAAAEVPFAAPGFQVLQPDHAVSSNHSFDDTA